MSNFEFQGPIRAGNNVNIAGRDNVLTGRDHYAESTMSVDALIHLLEDLRNNVRLAKGRGDIDEEIANETDEKVTRVIEQASQPAPEKKTMIARLSAAKALIEDIASVGGLVSSFVSAIEAVRRLFP